MAKAIYSDLILFLKQGDVRKAMFSIFSVMLRAEQNLLQADGHFQPLQSSSSMESTHEMPNIYYRARLKDAAK